MNWASAVTLAIAVLGAVLGVINTWNTISNRRVRLRVRPLWAVTATGQFVGIEVTNLSTFPVTVSDVGMLYRRPWSQAPERAAITAPEFSDGDHWPRKLDPREQVTAYIHPAHLPRGRNFWGAYARTICGEIAYGRSPALKQLSGILEGKQ